MNFSHALYAVTDRKESESEFFDKLKRALKGGVSILQLREKDLSEELFLSEAREVLTLCKKYGVPLIINDNVEVALSCGADGVHVGAEDTPPEEIKKIAPNLIVGVTAKTLESAKRAERAGADYLGVGAIFPSPTKPSAISVTREILTQICAAVHIPVFAIGGITSENLHELKGTGISGVALSSALFSAADICAEAQKLNMGLKNI